MSSVELLFTNQNKQNTKERTKNKMKKCQFCRKENPEWILIPTLKTPYFRFQIDVFVCDMCYEFAKIIFIKAIEKQKRSSKLPKPNMRWPTKKETNQ